MYSWFICLFIKRFLKHSDFEDTSALKRFWTNGLGNNWKWISTYSAIQIKHLHYYNKYIRKCAALSFGKSNCLLDILMIIRLHFWNNYINQYCDLKTEKLITLLDFLIYIYIKSGVYNMKIYFWWILLRWNI